MKPGLITGTILTLFVVINSARAAGVPFDTINYNFQLTGSAGGTQATLNGVTVEAFGDDFEDKISFPSDYSADVTQLSTTANLDETRFGEVSSWSTINLSGRPKTTAADKTFLNYGGGSTASARYDMAAYLVSLYSVGQGNNASNNEIQEAIWTLLDPNADHAAPDPDHIDPTSDLEQAVTWYEGMNTAGNRSELTSFLAGFEIVSPTNMKFKRGLGVGGFQEDIVEISDPAPDPKPEAFGLVQQIVVCPTPEPRSGSWVLAGLFGVAALLLPRVRRAQS
jgi:hypothetical protein